ncbi:MAG: hypothetical protein LBQ19_00110 [Synergistaceae bacterium]|jgi:hypothetical protein|nr:hypothetical protein [Synergistaceae bacterium]
MGEFDRFESYSIARGFIHGSEKNSRRLCGLFLGVASGLKLCYLGVRFTLDPVDKDVSWEELLSLLKSTESERNETLVNYENRLHDFLERERVLLSSKRALDRKAIERKTTYFCADVLGVSAVTFVELSSVTGEEIFTLLPFLKEGDEEGKKESGLSEDGEDKKGLDCGEGDENTADEIFIPCDPIIDPVLGIQASKLAVGESVYCRMPENSPFYKICAASVAGFDGVVKGEVTGVKINEIGTSVVALNLADGISGALKLSPNVSIKKVRRDDGAPSGAEDRLPRNILLVAAGVTILLCAMRILFHFLS